MSIVADLESAQLTIVSHYSALRKELNGEAPYTRADKDERSVICSLMITRLSDYVSSSEDITNAQVASVLSILNNLIGLRRALTIHSTPGNNQPYHRTEKSRDLASVSIDSYKDLFLEEEAAKLDTIPEYFS